MPIASTIIPGIPDDLVALERGREFLRFLRSVPGPAPYKKSALFNWSAMVGHQVTDQEVRYIIPGGDARTPQSAIIPILPADDEPPPDSIVTPRQH